MKSQNKKISTMKSQNNTRTGAKHTTQQSPKFSEILAPLKRWERHMAAAEKLPMGESKVRKLKLATINLKQSFAMAKNFKFTRSQLEKTLSIITKEWGAL